MAYKKAELEEAALNAIKEHKLYLIEDIVSFLPCVKKTFYDKKLHESPAIKKALWDVRVGVRSRLRKKWEDSESPTSQIALYKLIGTAAEAERLNGSSIKISGNEDSPLQIRVKYDPDVGTSDPID